MLYCHNPFFFCVNVAFFHLLWTSALFWFCFEFILLVELLALLAHMVPVMFCNRFEVSTLLFPLELLTTNSRYFIVWNTFFYAFSNFSSVELSHFSNVAVLLHKVPVKFFHCLQVGSTCCYFFLGHYKPILIITLFGLPYIFSVFVHSFFR